MTAVPSPSLTIRRARLSYGRELLFDGLDLTLRGGEITCLLGPSGIGKTSLLRLIAGLEAAADGQVEGGDGEPVGGRVAYMAQQDLLLPWLSALDNVLLGLRLRGERPDEARARRLLSDLGLGAAVHKRPKALSGGMRQRVALARTLMEARPFVLMDEPFSALDALTRLELQVLAGEHLRRRTVLLVTHDALEAARLADRILVMRGRPAELVELSVPRLPTPRAPDSPAVLATQASILGALTDRGDAA